MPAINDAMIVWGNFGGIYFAGMARSHRIKKDRDQLPFVENDPNIYVSLP